VIVRLKEELDATLVVVEHDLPLILAISNRIYCLEAGQVIVEGEPEAVRTNRVSCRPTSDRRTGDQRSNATL
jgi:ABC-type branched-subunit amino acid transport system ATPase component